MSKRLKILSTVLIVVLPVLIMLPRILSAQFGFFDDPATLTKAQGILAGQWNPALEAAHGRFRALYWYFYTAIYSMAGERPAWFFVANALILIAVVAFLYAWVRRMGGDRIQGWISVLVVLISGALIESAYTLSKPELLQSALIVTAAWLASFPEEGLPKGRAILYALLGGTLIFLASLTKETSLILVPVGAALVAALWGLDFFLDVDPKWRRWGWMMFISSLIGSAAYLILRNNYLPFGLIEQGYSSGFTFERSYLIRNAKVWIDILTHDYIFLLPLATLVFFRLPKEQQANQARWLATGVIWAGAWLLIYLPWRFTQLYYLLPFTLGAALLAGVLMSNAVWLLRQGVILKRVAGLAIVLTSGLLFIGNAANQVTNARLQLAMDEANDRMLNYVLAQTQPRSVVLLNIQEPNEYVAEFGILVRMIHGREDLIIGHVQMDDLPPDGGEATYFILPVLENQYYPSVRMGIFEHTSKAWDRALLSELPGLDQPDLTIRNKFRAFVVDPLRLFCPLASQISYCQVPNTPFDRRIVSYGWDVYVVGMDP